MNERWPPSFRPKVQWWAVGLMLVMICLGCAPAVRKPDTPAPAPLPKPEIETPKPAALPKPEPAPPPPAAPTPVALPPVEPAEKHFVHTVKYGGETVSIIAAWYTGDLENWKALASANPNLNPNLIFEGNKILIPESLLKTREPMPKEFVDGFYPKARTKTPPSKPVPSPKKEKEEEPDLFGPKQYPRR